MNDLPHPLEGKEAARASARTDIQGLDRTLVELIDAFGNSGQAKSREVLLAFARINRYITSIYQAITELGDDPEAEEFRVRVSEVNATVGQIAARLNEPIDTLLAEAEKLLEETPPEALEAWQVEGDALRERARTLLDAMQKLATELTARLGNDGGLYAGDFERIENLQAEYDVLAVDYERAATQFPDQQNLFSNEWNQTEILFRTLTKRLGRLSGQRLIGGEAPTKNEQEPEKWPPALLETTNDYLNTQDPLRHNLMTRLQAVAMLRPGQTDDEDLSKQGQDFFSTFANQEKKLRADVVTLAKLAAIAQSDQTVSINVRLQRENEVSTVQAKLEQFIASMNDDFEPLLWQKTLLFTVPEALSLQTNIDSYVQPNPSTTDMAGYMELRAGVTGLELAIQALVAAQPRITGGNTRRQQYLTTWIQGFNPNLTQRRDAAFQFWVMHLDTIHTAFNATNPNSLATAYATSTGIVNLDAAGVDVKALENRLTVSLGDARNEISTAVASGQLPPEAIEPAYATHLQTWWDKVATELARLNTAKERKEAFDYVEGIRSELNAIKDNLLVVSIDDNQVKDTYDNIRARYKEKIETNLLISELEKRKLEILITQSEYKHIRKAYVERIEFVEGKNLGLSLSLEQFGKVMDVRLIPRLNQLVSQLDRLSVSPASKVITEVDNYRADLEDVIEDYRCRKYAHISWARVWSDVIGNNESEGRKPPTGLSEDNFPLMGSVLEGLIKKGTLNHEFGGGFSGYNLSRLNFRQENPDDDGQIDDLSLNQSLFGFCMRMFDDVYRGKKDIGGVTTRNIHSTYDVLIKGVFDAAVSEYMHAHPRATAVPFTEHDVLVAWRLHSISTLNISYLAEASPTMPDNFYYLFNWVDYCIKYAFDQTNSFDPMQTLFVFGYGGSNPLTFIYSTSQLEEVREKLAEKGWSGGDSAKSKEQAEELWSKEAYTSFNALISAPLITLDNVSYEGNFVKAPMFEPPLRVFVIKEPTGTSGKMMPKRFGNQSGEQGKILSFDDLQTTDGARLYEQMPFNQIKMGEYAEYYNQIGKNAMWFLTNIFKAGSQEFLKKMDSSDFIKILRNQAKYAMPYFTKVGVNIREGVKRKRLMHDGSFKEQQVGETVMNAVVNQLVMAKCLMETDILRPKFWNINQVEDYLQELVRASAIIPEVAEAIKISVIEGRKWQMRGMDLIHKLQSQVENLSKVK